jgi:lysophospholipase L1-like esterase
MKHLIILFLVIMIGCKTQSVPQNQTADDIAATYLALGDSYTIGESVAESERWPVRLAKEMSDSGVKITAPKIIAKTGWTTDELKVGIAAANVNQTYDMVSLLIGVNNQYRGRDVEQFRGEFIDLLNQAVEFTGGDKERVFVVSIPDWGITPFAKGRDQAKIAQEIDAYNAVCKEELAKRSIQYFDITPISREVTTNADLVAPDGLHPSGSMYERWVKEVITPTLIKKLSKGKAVK